MESSAKSAAVFERHGLASHARWGSTGIPSTEGPSDAVATGLCEALEHLGGLYAAFARFLVWRADLLDASYTSRLRRVKINLPAIPAADVAARIRIELGAPGDELAAKLESAPAWNTLARTAYASTFHGARVIVEVAREPISERRFEEFERGVRSLGSPELSGIVAAPILAQFRECIRNGESLDRERSFLEALNLHRGDTLVSYPQLIPELSSASVLCWIATEGRPISDLIQQGKTAQKRP